MSAPDVVPVAWIGDVQRAYLQSGTDRFGVVSNVRNHGDALYSQATVDALQARIAPDVVPVALTRWSFAGRAPARYAKGQWILHSDAKATVDALQSRIDELEAQLFIAQANAALPLYEVTEQPLFDVLGLPPLPAFPSIRTNHIESKA